MPEDVPHIDAEQVPVLEIIQQLPAITACLGRLFVAIAAPVVAALLLLFALLSALSPPTWTARTADADGRIELTPEWGEGAFTSNDRLRLLPGGE